MMQYKIKQWFAVLLALMMTFTTLPMAALAESVTPTEGTKVEQVQAMIDELPEAEEITADNRADVQAQIDAIAGAMLELTEDEAATLDTTHYDAAVAALSALDNQTADPDSEPGMLEQVQFLIDALPDADTITADNRADVEAQLTAIDEAKLDLTDDERALLDTARYDAAVSSLSALDGQPSAGVPFGEGMLAFDSEEEALAYLWSLEDDEYGIMPIGELNDEKVDPNYFSFSIYGANESGTPTSYADFAALKNDYPNVTPTNWGDTGQGPNGGDLLKDGTAVQATLNSYPKIEGYRISSIRLNGTIIYHLGMYQVNDKTYVHFTSIDVQGRLTTVVLTKSADQYDNHPFEVRYVPDEYEITYEVFEGENDVTATRGAEVFGANKATETVDHWASVDVTIPAGYIGHVYIGNTEGFTINGNEKFPNEANYNHALGEEPKYTYNAGTNTIDIDTGGNTPDSYTLTGTYLVGSAEEKVSADQTVRVVLEKKTTITFHAEAWKDYVIGGTPTSNKADPSIPSDGGTSGDDGWSVTKNLEGDSADITWTITMKASYQDGSSSHSRITDAELRTLEINGATIKVPFVSATNASDTERTQLPSGAWVEIAAVYNNGNPNTQLRSPAPPGISGSPAAP